MSHQPTEGTREGACRPCEVWGMEGGGDGGGGGETSTFKSGVHGEH